MAKADQPDRGRARRRQERRLRRHGLHDGICRRASAPTDEVVEDKGVKLLIDPKAVLFLLGTEMDYKIDKLSSQFVFNNPNQTSACGCGESVQLTPAKDERRRRRTDSARRVSARATDADFIAELFAGFGPVDGAPHVRRRGRLRRRRDDRAWSPTASIYLKADDSDEPAFRARGRWRRSAITTKDGKRTLTSYWRMPERLYDEPEELGAMGAAGADGRARAQEARAKRRHEAADAQAGDKAAKPPSNDASAVSGDLGRGRRREFRIGLADHAVAAVALGRIEAGVGALDQRLRGVARAQRWRRRSRS